MCGRLAALRLELHKHGRSADNAQMLTELFITTAARFLSGASVRWIDCQPDTCQRIYFANHTSHIDTLAIWSALPRSLRRRTRPVAAKDYWGSGFRKYIATRALGAVLISNARQKAPLLKVAGA